MSGVAKRRAAVGAEPWRMLLSDPGTEWQQLPLATRGIAAELLRRLQRPEYTIVCAPGSTLVDAVHLAVVGAAGGGNKARQQIRTALEQLERHRWIAIEGDRLTAFFPDTIQGRDEGRSRPEKRTETTSTDARPILDPHSTVTGAAPELHSTDPRPSPERSSTDPGASPDAVAKSAEPANTHAGRRVEKSREEEKRERGGTLSAESLTVRAERIRIAVGIAFEDLSLPQPRECRDLTGPLWVALARRFDEPVMRARGEPLEVLASMLPAFLASPRARDAGFPISWLDARPLEYLPNDPADAKRFGHKGVRHLTDAEVLGDLEDR